MKKNITSSDLFETNWFSISVFAFSKSANRTVVLFNRTFKDIDSLVETINKVRLSAELFVAGSDDYSDLRIDCSRIASTTLTF